MSVFTKAEEAQYSMTITIMNFVQIYGVSALKNTTLFNSYLKSIK